MSLPEKEPMVAQVHTEAVYSDNGLKPEPQVDLSYELEMCQQKNMIYDARMRQLNFIMRIVSFILSAYMLGSMAFAYDKYITTKDKKLANGEGPWSPETVLWPTFMVLGTSVITLLLNLITLVMYIKSTSAADRSDTITTYIGYVMTAVHAVIWAINAGLFKMANTGNDLWGWSCSPASDAIQNEVKSFLNFNILCHLQSGTWYVTIIETVSYIVLFTAYVFQVRQFMLKRKLTKLNRQRAQQY